MNGIIPLMKPKGYTSHDCVQVMRRITKIKRIGHTGTLDPNVEGVLPICIGEATKAIPYMQQLPKTYIAEVSLGTSTTTEDSDGEIVESTSIVDVPTEEEIDTVLNSFLGEIVQIPPMYSAVRVQGKRLYEYARENIEVTRPKRHVTIHNITRITSIKDRTYPKFTIEVKCSKGTYIRTLAVDIGKKLGYPAHLSYLKRIETDSFTLDETVTLEEIERKAEEGKLSTIIEPIERGLQHLPVWQVPANIKRRVLLGQKLKRPTEMKQSPFLVMHNNQLLAIYKHHSQNEKEIKPVRVFNMYKNEGE
ncbi:MAG TPA: tRNA pseudouridine(55) synthase TruB [Pseudogracilibacillus sp.]|nr:tRNA pseudouridine(55) synthase TruB [Pseudogracilibacillus sp.]